MQSMPMHSASIQSASIQGAPTPQIARVPADPTSDDLLVERLYDLAMAGGEGSAEWQRLDEVIYTRLIDAYRCEAPSLRPRLVA